VGDDEIKTQTDLGGEEKNLWSPKVEEPNDNLGLELHQQPDGVLVSVHLPHQVDSLTKEQASQYKEAFSFFVSLLL
jgi:hypothetical protein